MIDLDASPLGKDRFAIAAEDYELLPKDLDSLLKLPGLERFLADEKKHNHIGNATKDYDFAASKSELVAVRAIQMTFGVGGWRWIPDQDDVSLGKGPVRYARGFDGSGADVVGHRLNLADGLSRDQGILLLALLSLPGKKEKASQKPQFEGQIAAQSDLESRYEGMLLKHVTRELRDPPLDLDVDDKSEEWEAYGYEAIRKRNTDNAQALSVELGKYGCKPIIYVTNQDKWSIHMDVLAPPGFRSARLSSATARVKKLALGNTSIADSGDRRGNGVVAIKCDTTIWERAPESRSGLWRPPLGRKYDKKKGVHKPQRKLWFKDLGDYQSLCEPPVGLEPTPFDTEKLMEVWAS